MQTSIDIKTAIIIFLILTASVVGRGQFSNTSEKGDFILNVSQHIISSNRYFDSDEKVSTIRTNSVYSTVATVEHQFANRWSFECTLPLFVHSTINKIQYRQSGMSVPGKSLSSFGDATIGIQRVVLSNKNFKATAVLNLGVPLGSVSTVGTDSDLQNGDGEFNQQGGVNLRLGSLSEGLHVASHVSYNRRTKDFSDEIQYGFRGGFVDRRFAILLHYYSIESLFNRTAPVSQNGIFSNHREVRLLGLRYSHRIYSRYFIHAGAELPITGRNTLRSTEFLLGIHFFKSASKRKTHGAFH